MEQGNFERDMACISLRERVGASALVESRIDVGSMGMDLHDGRCSSTTMAALVALAMDRIYACVYCNKVSILFIKSRCVMAELYQRRFPPYDMALEI
jgi:hypothetical protein